MRSQKLSIPRFEEAKYDGWIYMLWKRQVKEFDLPEFLKAFGHGLVLDSRDNNVTDREWARYQEVAMIAVKLSYLLLSRVQLHGDKATISYEEVKSSLLADDQQQQLMMSREASTSSWF